MNLFGTIRNRMKSYGRAVYGAVAVLLVSGLGLCMAQGPAAETRTVEGRVKSLTTAPKGEIDGAVLDDGNVLHWPPHLELQFTAIVLEGGRVKATGRTETGPEGDVHFEVETVTNMVTERSVTNADFNTVRPRPPMGPHGRGRRLPPHHARRAELNRAEIETVSGTVRSLTTAPRGETDGALLEDGTALHWPPHLQERFASVIKIGDQVRAKGRHERAPRGEENFEVQTITNTRSNVSVENPDFDGPVQPVAVGRESGSRHDHRIDDLQRQIDQIQRQLDRLRHAN